MSISPELMQIPNIALKFTRAGLTSEILRDFVFKNNGRTLSGDCQRLLAEYEKRSTITLEGIENISDGGIIIFNHPESNVLLPAMVKLIVETKGIKNKELSLVMATEIPMGGKLNDKISLPGSVVFLKRFHSLYKENIISTPTIESREDYLSGRVSAARKVISRLKNGEFVAIAPEGHTELNSKISPMETFHSGSGTLMRLATKLRIPTMPVAIWGNKNDIKIKIGESFLPNENDDMENVVRTMQKIALMLPEKNRGPFSI